MNREAITHDDYDDWKDCESDDTQNAIMPTWPAPERKHNARQRYDDLIAEKRLKRMLEDELSPY